MTDNHIHDLEREEWRSARDRGDWIETEAEMLRPTREEAEADERERG